MKVCVKNRHTEDIRSQIADEWANPLKAGRTVHRDRVYNTARGVWTGSLPISPPWRPRRRFLCAHTAR